MQYFITGIDTNVGKSFASSVLCVKHNLNYFKPIQTGYKIDDDIFFVKNQILEFKKKFNLQNDTFFYQNLYRFQDPLSPLACDIIEKQQIDKQFLIEKTKKILTKDKNILIEGAGGIFVPIARDFFILDYIKALKIPVVIIAEDRLGCINHTLLTIEMLLMNKIKIDKIIINKIKSKDSTSNYRIIKEVLENDKKFKDIKIQFLPEFNDNDYFNAYLTNN